jgi:aminotransferase
MTLQFDLNPDIANFPTSDRLIIVEALRGKTDLADLSSGNPNFPVPAFIQERLIEGVKAGYARYTDYYGSIELRTRISQYLEEECQIIADPEKEVLVTHGVQQGLYLVMRTILKPGDEVLLPSPPYGTYLINARACGAVPVLVNLPEENGFKPIMEEMEAAVTPRTKALIFSNPHNPLGVMWPREVLEELAEFSIKHNLIVLVDEVYRDHFAAYDPVSLASLPGMRERTFTFNGFSKSYMLMGLRMGYLAGPAALMPFVKKFHHTIAICSSSLGQIAAMATFDCPRDQVEGIYREVESLLDLLYQGVSALPRVSCVKPQAGFYLFPNFSRFGLTSLDLALQLIEVAGVIALPGTTFGPAGEGFLRLSVASGREQVTKGIARLTSFVEEFEA